jgi:2'-5' RNA ligase
MWLSVRRGGFTAPSPCLHAGFTRLRVVTGGKGARRPGGGSCQDAAMTQSVELLLDQRAEERVLQEWRLLDEAGLPSQLQHRGETNRPHVTLVAAPSVATDAEEEIARVCSQSLPLDVRLGAPALFGDDPVVLVRLVVPAAGLVALHASVAGLVVLPADSLLAPGRWTPHVTLARRLPLDTVPAALRALRGVDDAAIDRRTGFAARFERARRWDGVARRAWPL